MDGEITIGTRLDTDKFDRQVSDLEKKMKKEEDKKIVIDAKLESQQQELDKARQKTDALAEAYQRLKEVQDRLATGEATPKEFTTFQDLQNTYGSLEKLGSEFDKALSKQDAIEQKVAQTKYRYDEINARVSEYKQKIETVNLQKQVAEVDKMKDSFKNVGSSIQSSIKNVARLALGIFGIRSAYLALRRASSDLASYDSQYAANLEYIRYALTQAIAPVLQWIVRLAATLLGYINAIVQAWFGINLFSRGSAKNFQKMKAGASGVAKAAKEIKKQLAGFDEINMLTDQSDSGAGGGGGAGGATPNFDLSALQGEPPEWLRWIIDHKDEILAVLVGIETALILWKLGLGAIKALGIGIAVAGLVYAIQGLLGYLKEPTWENFGKIIQGIGIAVIGLGVAFLGLPAIITGVVILIVGTIIKYWDKIKDYLQNGIDWLMNKSDWVHEKLGDTIGNIYDIFVNNLQLILNWFDMTFKNMKQILDGIINFVKGVFTGNWRQAWEGVRQIFGGIFDWIKNTVSTVIQISWNNLTAFASTVGNAVASIFRAIVNSVLNTIERILNSPIRSINNLIGVINAIPGVNLSRLPTINLPRLKVGGIINMPNKGTMLGSAIGGESGKERSITFDRYASYGRTRKRNR